MEDETDFVHLVMYTIVGLIALTTIIALSNATKAANKLASGETINKAMSTSFDETGTYDDEDILTKVAARDGKQFTTSRSLIMSRNEVIAEIYAGKESGVSFIVNVTDMGSYGTLEEIRAHVPSYSYTKETIYDLLGNTAIIKYSYIPNT